MYSPLQSKCKYFCVAFSQISDKGKFQNTRTLFLNQTYKKYSFFSPSQNTRKICGAKSSLWDFFLSTHRYHNRSVLHFRGTYTNSGTQALKAVCPLCINALPVGKPEPGSCQFQSSLGDAVLLKKSCWLRGVHCFQSMGKKKGEKKGEKKRALLSLDLSWQLSLTRVFKEL